MRQHLHRPCFVPCLLAQGARCILASCFKSGGFVRACTPARAEVLKSAPYLGGIRALVRFHITQIKRAVWLV